MEAASKQEVETLDYKPLRKILKQHAKKRGTLIPILQETQKIYGYLPKEALVEIANKINMDISQVYGVATFYSQFRLTPVGKHIVRVCHGTACHVSGAERITESCEEQLGIRDGQTSEDREFTLESVACVGCCSLAPVMMIDETTHGRLSDRETKKILKKFQ